MMRITAPEDEIDYEDGQKTDSSSYAVMPGSDTKISRVMDILEAKRKDYGGDYQENHDIHDDGVEYGLILAIREIKKLI